MVNNNELAIQRTKLANHRTYLAYIRTGFVIASIAGTFKKMWIVAFGLLMTFGSSIQYYFAIKHLNNNDILNNPVLDYIPLIYIPLLLIVLYIQFKK